MSAQTTEKQQLCVALQRQRAVPGPTTAENAAGGSGTAQPVKSHRAQRQAPPLGRKTSRARPLPGCPSGHWFCRRGQHAAVTPLPAGIEKGKCEWSQNSTPTSILAHWWEHQLEILRRLLVLNDHVTQKSAIRKRIVLYCDSVVFQSEYIKQYPQVVIRFAE